MIRPLEPEDTDTVLEIWLRSSVAAHDFVPRSYWEGKLDEMRTRYLPDSRTFVYQDESAERRLRIRLAGRKLCRGPIRPSRPAGTRYRTPPAAMGRSAISDAGTERIRRKQTGRTLLPPGRFRNPTGTDRCEYRPQRAAFTASKQAILNHPMSNPRVTYRFTAMPVLQLRPQKTRRDASKR